MKTILPILLLLASCKDSAKVERAQVEPTWKPFKDLAIGESTKTCCYHIYADKQILLCSLAGGGCIGVRRDADGYVAILPTRAIPWIADRQVGWLDRLTRTPVVRVEYEEPK